MKSVNRRARLGQSMVILVALALTAPVFGAETKPPAAAAPAAAAAKAEAKPAGKIDPKLEEVFGDPKYQLTGVAVSAKHRVFTNYPIWSPVHKYCVVEVTGKTESKPYPDEEWNSWKPGEDGLFRIKIVP